MTSVADWITAAGTAALAIEGGGVVARWAFSRKGARRRELDAIHRRLDLVEHAVWLGATPAGQGEQPRVDQQVLRMLMLDGWQPDTTLTERAGRFGMHARDFGDE